MDMLDKIKEPYERIKAHAEQQQTLAERAIKTGKPEFFGTWAPTGEKLFLISESELARSSYIDQTGFVRPEVIWFARAMEAKLRLNEDKDHWSGETQDYLFTRLLEEVAELSGEIPHGEMVTECVDVANFAMMLADNNGGGL